MVIEAAERMTAFESAALAWYHRNFLAVVIEAGMLGQRLARLGLDPETEELFLLAVNMIRQMDLKMQNADARK